MQEGGPLSTFGLSWNGNVMMIMIKQTIPTVQSNIALYLPIPDKHLNIQGNRRGVLTAL